MSDPADVELSLRRKDATRYLADLVFSLPGSEVEVRPLVRTDITVTFDETRLRSLALDPDAYGRALGLMLFGSPDLATAFAQARSVARSQRRPLRLRLAIATNLPELHALRWETLRDPSDDLALALSEQVIFTRTLHSADWQPIALRAKGELRALAVIAAPWPTSIFSGKSPAKGNWAFFASGSHIRPLTTSPNNAIQVARVAFVLEYSTQNHGILSRFTC